MNYNNYDILGVMPSATRDDIDNAYRALRDKYQQERFQVGLAGEEAAEKLQEIEVAYRELLADLDAAQSTEYKWANGQEEEDDFDPFAVVKNQIKNNNLESAQQMLDEVSVRNAEWHYLQSVIFYKNNWFLEAKRQLEFAVSLEPNNERYQASLDKLNKIISSRTISDDQLRSTTTTTTGGMGGYSNGTCTGSSCGDCLMCNLCCNCMSCMGGC